METEVPAAVPSVIIETIQSEKSDFESFPPNGLGPNHEQVSSIITTQGINSQNLYSNSSNFNHHQLNSQAQIQLTSQSSANIHSLYPQTNTVPTQNLTQNHNQPEFQSYFHPSTIKTQIDSPSFPLPSPALYSNTLSNQNQSEIQLQQQQQQQHQHQSQSQSYPIISSSSSSSSDKTTQDDSNNTNSYQIRKTASIRTLPKLLNLSTLLPTKQSSHSTQELPTSPILISTSTTIPPYSQQTSSSSSSSTIVSSRPKTPSPQSQLSQDLPTLESQLVSLSLNSPLNIITLPPTSQTRSSIQSSSTVPVIPVHPHQQSSSAIDSHLHQQQQQQQQPNSPNQDLQSSAEAAILAISPSILLSSPPPASCDKCGGCQFQPDGTLCEACTPPPPLVPPSTSPGVELTDGLGYSHPLTDGIGGLNHTPIVSYETGSKKSVGIVKRFLKWKEGVYKNGNEVAVSGNEISESLRGDPNVLNNEAIINRELNYSSSSFRHSTDSSRTSPQNRKLNKMKSLPQFMLRSLTLKKSFLFSNSKNNPTLSSSPNTGTTATEINDTSTTDSNQYIFSTLPRPFNKNSQSQPPSSPSSIHIIQPSETSSTGSFREIDSEPSTPTSQPDYRQCSETASPSPPSSSAPTNDRPKRNFVRRLSRMASLNIQKLNSSSVRVWKSWTSGGASGTDGGDKSQKRGGTHHGSSMESALGEEMSMGSQDSNRESAISISISKRGSGVFGSVFGSKRGSETWGSKRDSRGSGNCSHNVTFDESESSTGFSVGVVDVEPAVGILAGGSASGVVEGEGEKKLNDGVNLVNLERSLSSSTIIVN